MSYYPTMQNPMFPPFSMGGRAPFQSTLAPPLYIGNLDETVYEEQLFALFSKYGPLHSLKIVKDRTTNRSKGFGYINFVNAKDAENARQLAQYEKIGKSPIRLMYKRDVHQTEGINIFVKNIDPTVTFKELHNLFARVGNVITVKIATNRRGESLGYGYVLMERKEDAEAAIKELNGYRLKEKDITCHEFVPKDKRVIRNNTNLYIKGLPAKSSKDEVQNLINQEFSKYGTILSHMAQQSKDGKWFAFVCYQDSKSAEEAIKNLHGSHVMGDEPLYVAWHQSRHERDFELKKNYANVKNENNLYVRNLKPEVTKEMLKQAFTAFGEVGSAEVKQTTIKNESRSYGFISFKVPQDAAKAQADGGKSDEIKNLFIDGQEVYISFWQPKTVRDQFKASKMRRPFDHSRMSTGFNPMPRGGNPFGQMPTDPRMMFPPFPMMNPNMMRPPYFGGQRSQQPPNRYPPKRPYLGGGGRQQMGDRQQTGERPNFQNRPYGGQHPRGGRPQHGGRPDQRGNFQASSQGQTTQQTHTHQQKETKPVQQEAALEANLTVQSLKDKLDEFLKLEPEKQRNILGELLFPKILRRSRPEHAPKITGMLVDFEVLTVQDILEMLEDDQILDERIAEAQELINSEGQ